MVRPAIHPGEILAEELAALSMGAAALARTLPVPTNRIAEMLQGWRGITADTAACLGQWFGTGPERWLNLQPAYELRKAGAEVGQAIRRTVVPRQIARDPSLPASR